MSPSSSRAGSVDAGVEDDSQGLSWSGLLGLGLAAALMVVVGFAFGWWADQVFDTSPILVLVGIGLGVAASISFTFVRIRGYLRE